MGKKERSFIIQFEAYEVFKRYNIIRPVYDENFIRLIPSQSLLREKQRACNIIRASRVISMLPM